MDQEKAELKCSFCRKSKVDHLIAGPGVYICNECLELGNKIIREEEHLRDKVKCSFCGKSRRQVKHLVPGPGVYICNECVELGNEIIREKKRRKEGGA